MPRDLRPRRPTGAWLARLRGSPEPRIDRKSTRLNSSHSQISYAVFCLKKKKPASSQCRLLGRNALTRARLTHSIEALTAASRRYERDPLQTVYTLRTHLHRFIDLRRD